MTTKNTSNSAVSIHGWINGHNIATSNFRTTSLDRIREALRKHPSYQTLFAKSEAASSVDHDSSILSPAAYFVDLMRLIEARITNGTQNNWGGLKDLKLEKRRPDLRKIELDAKNTTIEVPYLEIVNNVMRTHLAGIPPEEKELTEQQHEQKQRERDGAARTLLAEAQYPFALPVHMPLLQIRVCLAHFGVKLTDIYEAFGLSQGKEAWVAETLGFSSPDELARLATPDGNLENLSKAYGLGTKDPRGYLQDVERFRTHTALTPDELPELMQIEIPPWYWTGSKASLVFMYGGQSFRNISDTHNERLDYLNRFIRLRKRLGWSFSDLHWALRTISVDLAKRDEELPEVASINAVIDRDSLTELAQVKKLSDKYKLPVDVVCSFVHDMNTSAGFAAPGRPVPKSLFDRVFNTPPFYRDEGSGGGAHQPWEKEADPWDSTDMDPEMAQQHPEKAKRNQGIRASLLAALNVGNDDLQAIVDHCCSTKLFDQKHCLDPAKITLNIPTLTWLYRFSKMASVLGMRVPEYLVLLRCITGHGTHRLGDPDVSSLNDLQAIDYWANWLKETVLSPYQLEYLTTGAITHEAQHRVDRGWSDDDLQQLVRALHDTLEPLMIKPQSFVQKGLISTEEAAGVTTALLAAGLIVDVSAIEVDGGPSEVKGLVRCPVSGASAVSGKLSRVSRLHVIDALKHLAPSDAAFDAARSAARNLVCLKASFPDKQNRIEIPVAGRAKIVKAIQVARNTNWDMSPKELREVLEAVASHDNGALDVLTEFRSMVELNQQQLEELCALVIGDERNKGYFAQEQGREEGLAAFICLAKELEWSFTDLHLALKSVEGNNISEETLRRVWTIKCPQAKMNIPLDVMCTFSTELLTAGGDAAFDIPSFSEHLTDSGEDKERTSRLAAIRDELLRKAAAIQAITDTLNRELDFQMQSTIQHLASTFNKNWAEVAITVDYLNWKERGAAQFLTDDRLRDAGLLLYLTKALKLPADSFDAVLKNPSLFGFDSSRSNIRISLDAIRAVHAFACLVETFQQQGSKGKETASLLAELALRWSFDDQTVADNETLATLGGWQDNQIRALHDHLGVMSTTRNGANLATTTRGVAGLATMKCGFDLAAKLGVDVQMLIHLCKLHDAQTGFDEISAAAHTFLGVMKSKYSVEDWEKTFGPIRDNLNERERDALVGLLKHQLSQNDQNETIGKYFDGMKSLQDLSDYLLIDVEMSGVAKVSVVKQGLNTLQRYIQRCHMGLEGEGKVTFPIGDKEWSWRSHYRLWEANRKVFLYPENYLDPGLRKIKTPLFKELEDELLQGDITDETVTKVYINYFDKLEELASLQIVDACAAMVTHPGAPGGEETMFFIGKTDNAPPVYYYRSAVRGEKGQISKWQPWQKIALTIHVETGTCLYANHRLHLFWVEEKTTTDRDKDGNKDTKTKFTVKVSYHNISGSWLPPQVLADLSGYVAPTVVDPRIGAPFCLKSCLFPSGKPVATLKLTMQVTSDETKPKGTISFCDSSSSEAEKLAKRFLPKADGVIPFMVFDEAGVLRPTAPLHEAAVLTVSLDGRFLFCGTNKGVFRSENNGEQWEPFYEGLTDLNVKSLTASPDGRFLFAGTDTGIYRSEGNGEQWTLINKESYSLVEGLTASPDGQFLFAFATGDGVFRSENNGEQWEPINNGLTNLNVTDVTVSPDRQFLLAGTFGDGTFRFKINGNRWDNNSDKDLWNNEIHALTVGPDSRFLFAGTNAGVYRSENNGGNWAEMNVGLTNHTVYYLAASVDRLFIVAGTNGGVFHSEDNGENWALMNGGVTQMLNSLTLGPGGHLFVQYSNYGMMQADQGPNAGRPVWHTRVTGSAVIVANNQDTGRVLLIPYREHSGVHRLTSHAAQELRARLITGGMDALLSPATQITLEGMEPTALVTKPGPAEDYTPYSSYAIYYHEIFFHIPFLIADTLNRNQRFEDAQKWYSYVFDPIPRLGLPGKSDGKVDATPFWRYVPFKDHTLEKLKDIEKNNPGEFKIYTDDPFDPHAIAGLRLGAYEKAIVMKYIDNLLDWGDQLFAQDSWDSIVQAMMLYVLAQNLLGKKPAQSRLPPLPAESLRYDAYFDKEIDLADPFHVADVEHFPVAANTNFAGYWDRAEGRLFKIRHSMNIKGIVRQLALFQPPIDPRQLIRAMAAGGDITSVASQLSAPVPHYRFTTMIQQAKNVTSSLTQLGSTLLSALERKDAEQLNLLRSTHEKTILNLATRVKEKQIEDAAKNLDSLHASLEGAKFRKDHYHNLSDVDLIKEETSSLNLMTLAYNFQEAASGLHLAAVPGFLVPNIWGMADGGSNFGKAAQTAATVSENASLVLNQGSQLAATKAQNERRKEEWALQEALANHDADQIQAQIVGATIMQEITQMDLDMHQKSIEQAGEMEDLLRTKFTNRDLYQWMVGRISSVYFQTYKIAFDLAQAAEKAYQYERNADTPFIMFGYWDSLKKGLLTGESLMMSLNQLEKAYMDEDERTLEIEKTFSLLDLSAGQLKDLKNPENRTCTFNLTEKRFDQDFPGHYCRKIKSIAITLPAVVGPYQNVQAILRQDRSRLLPKMDLGGVKMLLTGLPKSDAVYSGLRPLQQIAISKGVDDSGLFELNFRDERYLPFEGTGAVSD